MSSDSGGALIGGLILIGIAIYVIAMIVAIASVLAMLALGVLSIWVSRSGGKALAPQEDIFLAMLSCVSWAGALALGCMLGSVGLLIALDVSLGDDFTRRVAERYDFGAGGDWTFVFLYDWIVRDSYAFAFNLALVLFIGNRIHVARTHGGWAWLAVLPPLFAMVLSFVIEHADTIVRFALYLRDVDLAALRAALIAEFIVPFQMLALAFTAPDEALAWARSALMETDGSFFRLATYFPWIFLLITVAFAVRHLFGGDTGVEA